MATIPSTKPETMAPVLMTPAVTKKESQKPYLSDYMLAEVGSCMHDDSFMNLLTCSNRIYKKENIRVKTLGVRTELVNRLFRGTVESLPLIFQNPRVLASLKALNLKGRDFREICLSEALAPFTGLQKLDMRGMKGLLRKDYLSFTFRPNLREFYVSEFPIPEGHVQAVGNEHPLDDKALGHIVKMMPNLHIFSITACLEISSKGYQLLASLKQLQELYLKNVDKVDDEAFDIIAKSLTNLRKLNLGECRGITVLGCYSIVYLQDLRELDLSLIHVGSMNNVNDVYLQVIVQLPHLEKLCLSYCEEITSKGMQLLASSKNIRYLDLFHTNVDDNALQAIGRLAHLRVLKVANCKNITSNGFELFAKLSSSKNLEELYFDGAKVNDAAFRYIPTHFPNLKYLGLSLKDASTFGRVGEVYRQLGNLDKAKAYLEEAIKMNPKDALAYERLSEVFRQQGDFEKARAHFEKAAEINPEYRFHYEPLKYFGRWEDAELPLTNSNTKDSEHDLPPATVGNGLPNFDNWESDQLLLDEVPEIDPKDDTWNFLS